MTSAVPGSGEHKPFNPTWITAALALAVAVGGGLTTRAQVDDLRERTAAVERWKGDTAVQLEGMRKDLASIDKGVSAIQQALLGRGVSTLVAPARAESRAYPQ